MATNNTDICTINEAVREMEAHGVQLVDKITLEPVLPDNVVLMPERRH